jgi:hypothetical protein
MKNTFLYNFWPFLFFIVCCTGCSNVGVRVQRDPEIKDVAVQVDVIPIPEDQKDEWTSTNVTAFWSQVITGNANKEATILQFSPGEGGSQSMKVPPKGVDYFVVISDYPSVPAGQYTGANDPRLCIIPIDKLQHGFFGKSITVKIERSGIQPMQ